MSPTWAEVRAAKDERLRREARLYTPDKRGPDCPVCRTPTVQAVTAATGDPRHITCAEPALMALGQHAHHFTPHADGRLYGKVRFSNRCRCGTWQTDRKVRA